jgi:glycosyltransferase involved in cell wall biosynthesis
MCQGGNGKLKVLNIILEPRIGGPQLRIANVGQALQQEFNIETIVLFPDNPGNGGLKFKKILEDHGLAYKTLRLCKISKSIPQLIKWLFLFMPETLRLKRAVLEIDPDIVHCNGSWQLKGVIAAKMAGKKVVWHLNDTKIPFGIRIIFGILSRIPDGYIFAGEKVKAYYLKYLKRLRHAQVIHAPVDTQQFDPDIVQPDPLLVGDGKLKVVTIANVNPVKGIEYFIEAAYMVSKRFENVEFIIVGEKLKSQRKYIATLEEKISEYKLNNIRFYGFSDSIASILKATDVFVCSSIAEAAPRAVWEAMAMKKPIVSTDVGAVNDFVRDNENGFIVAVGDSRGIADKIEYLVGHKEIWSKFGEQARKITIKVLDVNIIARLHMEFYRNVLESPTGLNKNGIET